jgi:carboxyl-terminal processing protease
VIVGGLLGAAPVPQQGISPLRVFGDVTNSIFDYYVEATDPDKVLDGAMRGLVDDLDPASAYLTPEEVRALDAKTPAPAGDVGLVVMRQFYLRVLGVRDGSPAQQAGLLPGDFIRAIDDRPTRDMSTYTGMHLLRGAPGSKVTLLVIRSNTADPRPFSLVREAPKEDHVAAKRLASGEAYLRVTSFSTGAADALRTSLTPSQSASTARPSAPAAAASSAGVIIDLRGIADGTPDEGIAAARSFLKSGSTIAVLAGRAETDKTEVKADRDGGATMPVVLLVSDGTANAAEVFAAALARNKRAVLVGEPTAGMAAVQRLVRLPEGGLWLTYQRYLQSDGTPIHEKGLRPDVVVDIPAPDFDEAPPTTDAALTRAEAELKKLRAPVPDTTVTPPVPPTRPETMPPTSVTPK